jgi:membrane-bound metal-dependent hydrolase YbcI (DUF457 family)
MANFHTHIGFSTMLGCGYAGMGYLCGAPAESAVLAGGLCGISGMLPDIDSDKGIPLRETMAFAAAVVPLLTVDRMQALGLTYEWIVLAGAATYLIIRFGVAKLLARYTVHRGMFHSIPAALVFAGLAFLLTGCGKLELRYYKAGAVLLGYLSHLVLDEIYSVEFARGRFRLKRSFGTALKFWGRSLWANVSTYSKLIVVATAILSEPAIMDRFGTEPMIVIRSDWREAWEAPFAEGPSDGSATDDDKTIYDTARRLFDGWQ